MDIGETPVPTVHSVASHPQGEVSYTCHCRMAPTTDEKNRIPDENTRQNGTRENVRTHTQGGEDEANDKSFDRGKVDPYFAQPRVYTEIQDGNGYDDR